MLSAATSDLFVVEDDVAMREALSVVLTIAGYRVTSIVDYVPINASPIGAGFAYWQLTD